MKGNKFADKNKNNKMCEMIMSLPYFDGINQMNQKGSYGSEKVM